MIGALYCTVTVKPLPACQLHALMLPVSNQTTSAVSKLLYYSQEPSIEHANQTQYSSGLTLTLRRQTFLLMWSILEPIKCVIKSTNKQIMKTNWSERITVKPIQYKHEAVVSFYLIQPLTFYLIC